MCLCKTERCCRSQPCLRFFSAVMDVSAQRLFPHWCSHAAHVLSFILLAGSIGISVWIGMGFGSSVALMWLLSGIFSFLTSFFVLEPLKVILRQLVVQ